MKSFALSALALVALSSASAAGESEEDWYTLDKELELLSANVAAQERPGPTVGAWLKTDYRNSSDIVVGSGDLSGFGFQVIRVLVDGSVGDTAEYRISLDGASGVVEVLDAYAHLHLSTGLGLRVGQMKSEIMFTSIADRDKQLLYDRSYLGTIFNERDLGAQLYGNWKAIDVYLGLFNGNDELANDMVFNAKGVFTFGDEVVRGQSGGYGMDTLPRFSFGIAYVEDANVDKATATTLEFVGVSGPFWLGLEAAEFGDGFVVGQPTQGILGVAGSVLPTVADTTPWGATVGLGINDSNELAFRWDNTDNSADDKIMTGGYTYYSQGHAAKVQVNYTRIDSGGPDTDLLTIGLTGSI